MSEYTISKEYEQIFIGRKAELKWLDNRLLDTMHSFSPTFISGIGGVGKTSLMKYWLTLRTIWMRRERPKEMFENGYREFMNDTPLWLDLHSHSNKTNPLEDFVNYIRENREEKNGIIAVIDGTEDWTEKQHEEAVSKIYNYKAVSNLVFISRKPIKMNRSETLGLLPMSQSESSEMLNKLLSDNLNENSLLQAIAATQGYPLAIALLTQLLKGNTPTSILSELNKPLYELSNNILLPKNEIIPSVSPIIVSANQNLAASLKKQPSDLHTLTPREFEILLAELLRDMGWEVELTKQTRDGGADILAYLNTDVGRLLCLVEAKHYRQDRKIGVDLVRTLYGTLCDAQANSAMLVTSSSFTNDAREFQQKHKYQLNLREYADIVTWIAKYGNKTNYFA